RTYYTRPTPSHLQFLFDLYTLRNTDPTLYQEYEMFVSTKMLGLISRLSWKPVRLSSNTVEIKSGGSIKKVRQHKTLVIPKVQIGTSHITFNQLSEGTFKTLALIFYIMTDKGSCLLIEEPEVCIHHGLLRRILSTIKAHSKTRQVIFSTHSDLVLDAISTNEVFVVDMKKSITKVSSLSDWAGTKGMSALKAYLNEAGTLGEYWRSGGLVS
ncbi:MAG TPA: AAA family ATPase, partial [Candidatus Saccharimonadales bacterium]